jgi:sulfatase maturation enzyme AslB (radical SAM superfamily)
MFFTDAAINPATIGCAVMQNTVDFIPAEQPGSDDILVAALTLIGEDGVAGIAPAFDILRAAGGSAASPDAQPVLIEALFQMLEGLAENLSNLQIHALATGLDAETAEAAATILKLANFPDGAGQIADLDDATLLLLAALAAAAGDKLEAKKFLEDAEIARPSLAFWKAAFTLRARIVESVDAVVDSMMLKVVGGNDHPELWEILPDLLALYPDLTEALERRARIELVFLFHATILRELCRAADGDAEEALHRMEPIATANSLSLLAQGAFFHIKSLVDPTNPVYHLKDYFCTMPFEVIDVLDGGSHLCCASWVPVTVGNMETSPWPEVWNSETAQSIRASVHDGSFRYCNKTACPYIGNNQLKTKADVIDKSDDWRDIVENKRTTMIKSPYRVNLAYDQTCNLSCPSCRKEKIAADSATRERFDKLQEEAILPLLRESRMVFITGSGDPFASKNFRKLMERLGPDDYPDLKFQIMTNGMLFNRREWERFPALHGRIAYLRISIDAGTGPTHELLRRGARWPVMEENLAFVRELRAEGEIEHFALTFVVQTENFKEMGDAVDLARCYGADSMGFFRLTNWGTYSDTEYADKAVFMPSHPRHREFLEAMQDPRLRDPIASLQELNQFVTLETLS